MADSQRVRAFLLTEHEEANGWNAGQKWDYRQELSIVTCEPDGSEIRNPSGSFSPATTQGRVPEQALEDIQVRVHGYGWQDTGWQLSGWEVTYWNTYGVNLARAEQITKALKYVKKFQDDLEARGYRPATYAQFVIMVGQALNCKLFLSEKQRRGSSYADNQYEMRSVSNGAAYCERLFKEFTERHPLETQVAS